MPNLSRINTSNQKVFCAFQSFRRIQCLSLKILIPESGKKSERHILDFHCQMSEKFTITKANLIHLSLKDFAFIPGILP